MLKRQFTATVYILDQDTVLLHYHKKLQKWLPPGGHLEFNELPHEAAWREAFEETGLEVEFILQENIWIDRWNAKSIPRPYLYLLEEIPQHGHEPQHQHIDAIYVAKPRGGELFNDPQIRWFTLDEVSALEGDVEIFIETQLTIKKLLSGFATRT